MFDPKTIIFRIVATICEKVSVATSVLLLFWMVSVIIDPERTAAISHLSNTLMIILYFITLAMTAANILLERHLKDSLPINRTGGSYSIPRWRIYQKANRQTGQIVKPPRNSWCGN